MIFHRYAWLWVVILFVIAAILSKTTGTAQIEGKGWYPMVNIPPGAIIREVDIAEGEVIVREDELDDLASKEEIVGKKTVFGIKSGYGITQSVLRDPDREFHEISIPIALATSTRPEQLKRAMVWVNYDPQRYPGRMPESITEVAVIDLLNNRGISIFNDKSTLKVPISAVLYVPEESIAIIKAKGQQGELFLTNPYSLMKGGGGGE